MSQIDPVCGKMLRPVEAVASTSHELQMYHFCSQECHGRFLANPAVYVTDEFGDQPVSANEAVPSRVSPLPWHMTE